MPDMSSDPSPIKREQASNLSSDLEVRFYRSDKPFFSFTNFSPHPVIIGDKTWATTEHFFQAQKFVTTDPSSVETIWCAKTPGEAAELGRDRARPLRRDWEQVKDTIMRIAVFTKLLTYSEIRNDLLGTGRAVLIEDSPYDSYWGCGADSLGKNMLGRILVEAREIIVSEGLRQLQKRTGDLCSAVGISSSQIL